MLHIGKYFGYIFNGAIKILFYPHQARKYIKNKEEYPLKERFNFINSKAEDVLFNILKVKLDVEGYDKLDQNDTFLFVPNHQGMLDAVALLYLLKEPAVFVSKKEAEKYIVIGKMEAMVDAIFYDRESPRDALNMTRACNKHLKENTDVVIFAEGTRSKNENVSIGTYKPGAFKSAYGTGAKIVPVVIDKSYIPLSVKMKNTDKVIKVRFLDPISSEEYEKFNTSELAKIVEDKAKEELEKLRNS